ncbi:hypothetical protein GGS21DRAFT_549112 [Xylaria nigripes]|nr:hypothetical protein GGS21DRAFT_549112 [Xylaria nigripes]
MENTTATAAAATTAIQASNSPRTSPVMSGDASQAVQCNTEQPHPNFTGESVGASGVDSGAALQINAASSTASPTAAPAPKSAQVAFKASSQSPTPNLPSTQTELTQPPLPGVSTGRDDKQPVVSPALELHQNHQDQLSTTLTPFDPLCLAQPLTPRQTESQFQTTGSAPRRFPSPESDHAIHISTFNRDLSLLGDAIHQACPPAVREVMRDNWKKSVLGSEFHFTFLFNAITRYTSGDFQRHTIRSFGQNLVIGARQEIASHLRQQDIDAIASTILAKCSDGFLDKALEQRLKTINARALINALARAERLGYEVSDILEEKNERVIPGPVQVHNPPAAPPAAQRPLPVHTAPHGLAYQVQPPRVMPPANSLHCKLCWRSFKHKRAYEYHMNKQLCTKPVTDIARRRFTCEECGAIFATKLGQQYHIANAVCGPRDSATPSSSSPAIPTPRPETQYAHQPIPSAQVAPTSSQPYSVPPRRDNLPMENARVLHANSLNHLHPSQKAQFMEELKQIQMTHAAQCKEAEKIEDPAKGRALLASLHRSLNTKRGLLEHKYGLKLAQVGSEKQISHSAVKHGLGLPDATAEMSSAKRQRYDSESGNSSQSPFVFAPRSHSPAPSTTSHSSIFQLNSGLGTSTATAALVDPTSSALSSRLLSAEQPPPQITLLSSQQKGFKVSSHLAFQARSIPSDPDSHAGSASKPVVLDDSSDGTDDDEEEIPAILPSKKTS